MLDSDLAELYGVETKRINEAFKNNPDKFPDDFMFELSDTEFKDLRSKISTTKFSKTRVNPKAFTEQGVYMLATILKSKTATEVTISIMRAFVKMRNFSLTYTQVIDKLKDIDIKIAEHDDVLHKVLEALSELMREIQENETRKIGFVIDE